VAAAAPIPAAEAEVTQKVRGSSGLSQVVEHCQQGLIMVQHTMPAGFRWLAELDPAIALDLFDF
jgi:hypothetical protein